MCGSLTMQCVLLQQRTTAIGRTTVDGDGAQTRPVGCVDRVKHGAQRGSVVQHTEHDGDVRPVAHASTGVFSRTDTGVLGITTGANNSHHALIARATFCNQTSSLPAAAANASANWR